MNLAFFGDSLISGRPGASFFERVKAKLAEHELHNYGRAGDTVKSHYRRIKLLKIERPFDIAVLWIGVNDVWVHLSPTFPWIKRLRRQPWCKTVKEFSDYYIANIDWLVKRAGRVIIIPPLFIGEDPGSGCNRQLEKLSAVIRDLTVYRDNVEYLDLRSVFIDLLPAEARPEYLPRNALRILLDYLFMRKEERVNKKSAKRGLTFTLDGVHLNGKGADIVADAVVSAIGKKQAAPINVPLAFE